MNNIKSLGRTLLGLTLIAGILALAGAAVLPPAPPVRVLRRRQQREWSRWVSYLGILLKSISRTILEV
jgi:hypothetical protein